MYKKLSDEALGIILEAGIEEFSRNGPEKASVRAIAQRAGVSVGVLYKYYADKESLFLACVRHSLELLDRVLSEAVSDEHTLEESIDAVLRALIEHARSHGSYNAMYNEITSGSCRSYAALLSREIECRSAAVYSALFEKARQEGRLRTDADSSLCAFFFDNLLITLQFSYCCDYYRERMKIFCGEDIFDNDEKIITAFRGFICAALQLRGSPEADRGTKC